MIQLVWIKEKQETLMCYTRNTPYQLI